MAVVSEENDCLTRLAFMNKMQDMGHIMRLAVEIIKEEFEGNANFWSNAVSKAFFLKNSNYMEGEIWDASAVKDFHKSIKSEYKTLLSKLKDQMKCRNEKLYGLCVLVGQSSDPISDNDVDLSQAMSHTAHEIIIDFNTFLDSLQTLPNEYFDEQIQSKLTQLSQRLSSTFLGQNKRVNKSNNDENITVAENVTKSKISATSDTSALKSEEVKVSIDSTKNNEINSKSLTESDIIPEEVSQDQKSIISKKILFTKTKANVPKLVKVPTSINPPIDILKASNKNKTNVESQSPKKNVSLTDKPHFKSPVNNYQRESANVTVDHSNQSSLKGNKIPPAMNGKMDSKIKLDNSNPFNKNIEKKVSSEMANGVKMKDMIKHVMKDIYMTNFGNDKFYCCLCDIQISSITNAMQHLTGNKHRSSLGPGKEYKPNKQTKVNANASKLDQFEGDKHIIIQNERYCCKLCGVPLSSYGNAVEHVSGSRHREMLKKLSTSESKEKDSLQRLNYIVPQGHNQYYCQICASTVSGSFGNVLQHVEGFNHKNAVQLKTAPKPVSIANKLEKLIINGNGNGNSKPNSEGIITLANGNYYCMYCESPMSVAEKMLDHILRSRHNANKSTKLKKP